MFFGKSSQRRRRAAGISGALVAAFLFVGASPAHALDLKVNFQKSGVDIPPGYTADNGREYSATRGFGWVREDSLSNPTHTGLDVQDRAGDTFDAVPDQRFDTWIALSKAGAPNGAWEAAVPNGSYTVTVAAGDALTFNSTHRVNVEGVTALNWTASTNDRQRTSSATVVNVTDGLLTLTGIGGTNVKFDYVDISTTVTAPSGVNYKYTFAPSGAAGVSGYVTDTGGAYSTTTGYGWVRQDSLNGTHQPVALVGNGRERNAIADQRLDTFMHMQYGNTTGGTKVNAAWERAVPNGSYDVTVGVGDPSFFDSVNAINIEGVEALEGHQSVSNSRFRAESQTVTVTDGRLTIDAIGGTNTKIDYVTIDSAPVPPAGRQRPTPNGPQPADGSVGVARGRLISSEITLPNVGIGLDDSTFSTSTIRLERISDGALVAGTRNTSGGGDVIVFQPTALLEKNTEYRMTITSGVKDKAGAPVKPLSWVFTTNAADPGTSTAARFIKTTQSTSAGIPSASLKIGPDNRLYATTLDGKIDRYPINADGSLGTPFVINTIFNQDGERHILGLAFDPASTATNPILWVSHSYPAIENSVDWTGKISRLSGTNLGTIQDYVTQLPRSVNDHETNSLAFGPDGNLYVTQGSNSAAGAPDVQWGNRLEHKLNAAVLKIDLDRITSPPLNVKTDEGGTYDPFATNAPVSVYASGVRNAYDLVWHSNGQLYTAVNGTAAHGNTPGTPSTLPTACQKRIDSGSRGAWTGPAVAARNDIIEQPDLLFRIQAGSYYGHPNPSRCEYTFFGGNPTSGADPLELGVYPIGTQPDRNYKPASYNFGFHYSPNGLIEYQSNVFNGALKGRLMVARYSGGDDIVALDINGTTKEISGQEDGIPGLGGLVNPLDLTEDTRNGNLYVTELGAARIALLKPDPSLGGGTTTPPATTPPPSGVGSNLYRIDVGAASNYTDTAGNVWTPDTGLFTPSNAAMNGTAGTSIDNTNDDPLFSTDRGNTGNGTPQANRTLNYSLPVTATAVNVKLLMSERYWTAAGKRLISVSMEGQTKFTNYDLFVKAGGVNRAYTETFNNIAISGGRLDINMSATKDFPALGGIEVTCAAGC